MQFLNTYSSLSIDYMLQILIVHAGTNWKSNTFETALHSYCHHALKQYIHNTNICQPTLACSDLFTAQPISLHQIGQTTTNTSPSTGTSPHVRWPLLCGVENQIYEIVHIENRVNLHNPPRKIFRFSLFIFFPCIFPSALQCVCVPKFICHTVQIHEHALAYLHHDDDDDDGDDDVHVGDNDDGSDDNMCA